MPERRQKLGKVAEDAVSVLQASAKGVDRDSFRWQCLAAATGIHMQMQSEILQRLERIEQALKERTP